MMLGRQRGQILGFALLVSLLGTVKSFGIVPVVVGVQKHSTTTTTCLYEKKKKVTEEDVIVAVEKAETLWEQALKARETAEELSALAENFGNEAASSAKEAEEDLQALKDSGKFGLGQIANAQIAMNTSFDAGTALTDAFDATEEADRLEQLAEEALKESEQALAQHLIDFPENNE